MTNSRMTVKLQTPQSTNTVVPGKPLQPSVMFVSKSRADQGETTFRCSTLGKDHGPNVVKLFTAIIYEFSE
jgi:hypothetical protein